MTSLGDKFDYEHVIADNYSLDGTLGILREIAREDARVKVIANSRNFGAEKSAFNGMKFTRRRRRRRLAAAPARIDSPADAAPSPDRASSSTADSASPEPSDHHPPRARRPLAAPRFARPWIGPGVVVGGGFGLQYTKNGEDIVTDNLNLASAVIAGGGLRPRFLASVGYAF